MSTVEEHNQDLVNRFEKSMETKPDGSANAWVSGIRTYSEWCDSRGFEMDDMDTVLVDDYLEFVGREYVNTSAGTKLDSIKHFYDWCSRKGLCEIETDKFKREDYGIKTDTTRQAKALRQSDDYIAIPKNEVQKIITNVPSPKSRNETLVRLLWCTGIRTSEIVEIRLEDIDWDEQHIRIKDRKNNQYRKVWFGDSTRMVMREWVDLDRETTGKHGKESPYLFLTTHSPKMRASHVSRLVKESADEAGINEVLYQDKNGKDRWKITGHTIRHSMASHHANILETPIHQIKTMLGHSSIDTTMKYVKEDEQAIAKSMKKLG